MLHITAQENKKARYLLWIRERDFAPSTPGSVSRRQGWIDRAIHMSSCSAAARNIGATENPLLRHVPEFIIVRLDHRRKRKP
jgi:hypothetical protein